MTNDKIESQLELISIKDTNLLAQVIAKTGEKQDFGVRIPRSYWRCAGIIRDIKRMQNWDGGNRLLAIWDTLAATAFMGYICYAQEENYTVSLREGEEEHYVIFLHASSNLLSDPANIIPKASDILAAYRSSKS